MEIIVTWGIGKGNTPLGAFDNSLWNAGIGNFNLIYLSSVIPPNASVRVKKINYNSRGNGDKLYVVISKGFECIKGREIWVGLGWILEGSYKCGVFIENSGSSFLEVRDFIDKALKDIESKRNLKGKKYKKIIGIKCGDKTVCAVVCAIFKSEKW